ncbi:DUF2252 family protein [Oerskovia sp. M15]
MRRRPPGELRRVRLSRALPRLRHQRLRRDAPRPFEWDLQRLVASLEIAGRHRGLPHHARERIVLAAAREYRETLRSFADLGHLDLWHVQLGGEEIIERWSGSVPRVAIENLRTSLRKARTKDRQKARRRLTAVHEDGSCGSSATRPCSSPCATSSTRTSRPGSSRSWPRPSPRTATR